MWYLKMSGHIFSNNPHWFAHNTFFHLVYPPFYTCIRVWYQSSDSCQALDPQGYVCPNSPTRDTTSWVDDGGCCQNPGHIWISIHFPTSRIYLSLLGHYGGLCCQLPLWPQGRITRFHAVNVPSKWKVGT